MREVSKVWYFKLGALLELLKGPEQITHLARIWKVQRKKLSTSVFLSCRTRQDKHKHTSKSWRAACGNYLEFKGVYRFEIVFFRTSPKTRWFGQRLAGSLPAANGRPHPLYPHAWRLPTNFGKKENTPNDWLGACRVPPIPSKTELLTFLRVRSCLGVSPEPSRERAPSRRWRANPPAWHRPGVHAPPCPASRSGRCCRSWRSCGVQHGRPPGPKNCFGSCLAKFLKLTRGGQISGDIQYINGTSILCVWFRGAEQPSSN